MRKIYKKQSLWSKIVNFSFIFFSDKKYSSSEERAKKFIKHCSLKDVNERIFKGFKKEVIGKNRLFFFNGGLENNTGRVILYVHGGNFVQKPNSFQINFAKKIAIKTNSALIVPMYDLLPNGNYKKMYNLLSEIYDEVLKSYPSDIYFLGDSAGGGAVLSFAMQLREKKCLQPSQIILVSPWLDLSMTNPKLYDDAKNDRMNSVDGIRYEGKLWADGTNVCNPIVSPMYGNFDNLGKMSIIFGGRGILSSECKKFDKILTEQKIDHNYILYEKEGHDFAAYPTKEGGKAINDIVNIINSR